MDGSAFFLEDDVILESDFLWGVGAVLLVWLDVEDLAFLAGLDLGFF